MHRAGSHPPSLLLLHPPTVPASRPTAPQAPLQRQAPMEVFGASFRGWAPCVYKHLCLFPHKRVFAWVSGSYLSKGFSCEERWISPLFFLTMNTAILIMCIWRKVTHDLFDQHSIFKLGCNCIMQPHTVKIFMYILQFSHSLCSCVWLNV